MKIFNKETIKQEFCNLLRNEKFRVDEAIDEIMKKLNSGDFFLMGDKGIYVYMGTYNLVPGVIYPEKKLVPINNSNAEIQLFYELDSGLSTWIDIGDDLEDFKENNTIIYIPNIRGFEADYTYEQDFNKLRKIYIKELCVNNEEQAVSLVTSEDYIKKVFSVENYMKENDMSPVLYDTYQEFAHSDMKTKPSVVVLKKTRK